MLDADTPQERRLGDNVTLCAIGNTRSYGGGMYICPEANHHDGLLDVTVLGRMNRAEVMWKFGKIFKGNIRGENGVELYRAKTVSVELHDKSGAPINGYADGEFFAPTPMDVFIRQGAGKYLVPRP